MMTFEEILDLVSTFFNLIKTLFAGDEKVQRTEFKNLTILYGGNHYYLNFPPDTDLQKIIPDVFKPENEKIIIETAKQLLMTKQSQITSLRDEEIYKIVVESNVASIIGYAIRHRE